MAREQREIELKENAERAEEILQERLSRSQILAEIEKKKHSKNKAETDEFKQEMHQ